MRALSDSRSAIRFWLLSAILSFILGLSSLPAGAASWSFGVMGNTQWTCPTDPAGANPGSVSVSVINQLNAQFIERGVKFVIQVGDLMNFGGSIPAGLTRPRRFTIPKSASSPCAATTTD